MLPPSHLGALREGALLLRRHAAATVALAALAMVLAQLGPVLELAAGAGHNVPLQALFGVAGLLPMEMYFLPRLQAQLDAETLNHPANPAGTWREAFDGRWVQVFLVRLALGMAAGLGALFFLIPGLIILTLFGWAPLRMLLRGDPWLNALRWSQSAMARHWPRVLQAVLAIMLMAILFQMVEVWALSRILPGTDPDLGPDALIRLRHPAFWIINLLGSALNLWITCALLALYHRLEAAVAEADQNAG